MATLEESFLADLAELSDGSEEEDDLNENNDQDTEMPDASTAANYDEVGSVAKLPSSAHYIRVMKDVRDILDSPEQSLKTGTWAGASEEDPTYKLLLDCLGLVVSIDNEIASIHNYMKDKYKTKFPELASFVHDPVQYARTIQVIGNEMDLTRISLEDVLPQHVIMGVTVTATTTEGKELPEETLEAVLAAGRIIVQLDADKALIINLVQQSMHNIAPNLSKAVGEEIAARLIGAAGGLSQLASMPACNVQVLGAKRKVLSGFSTVNAALHQGFIYACEVMEQCPQEFKQKAARLIGAKAVLLARTDNFGSDPSGAEGAAMKETMLSKIEKWQELPPGKTKNVLPVPDMEPKKRRGGKRWRKLKEKYAVTDMQKAQNRIKFNEAEEEILDGDEVVGLGMMGKGGIGKLAGLQARQTTMKMSKNTQKRLNQQAKRPGITSSMIAGTASSLAFTPVQGIELENPSAKAGLDRRSGTESYFSDYGGFKSIVGKPG